MKWDVRGKQPKPIGMAIDEAPEGSHIPRVIHQTFKPRPWPDGFERYDQNMAAIQRMNPGWEHRFYDYDDRRAFIAREYGADILRRYDAIDPAYGAARADLFRYLLLYKEGGVYLDMKSSTARPLDEVLLPTDRFLLSNWRNERVDHYPGWGLHRELAHLPFGEFQQWFIISAPGHPFLRAVIQRVLRNLDSYMVSLHGVGGYAVLRATGPVPYTLAIDPLRDHHACRLVDSVRDLGLVYSIFDTEALVAHREAPSHYTRLSRPLVQRSFARSAIDGVLVAGKSAYRRLRGRRRASVAPAEHGAS